MKKILKILAFVALLFPLNVFAEELKCSYHYYYNGNSLNQGSTPADFDATCTFTIKNDKVSNHSCKMNYYFKGEEKTKKVSLDNYSATGNYKFVYTSDGKSVKEVVGKEKKCPSYVVAYYNVKSGPLGGDRTSLTLDAAYDETRAQEMLQHWFDVSAYNVHILPSTSLPVDPEEQKEAYAEIEKWIEMFDKALQSQFDFSTCADEDDVITKYSECKTKINNMETALTTIEKTFNDYVNNGIVDKNDSRVKQLKDLLHRYKLYLNSIKQRMEELDCEIKKDLGLVDSCDSEPGDVVTPPDMETDVDYDFNSLCTSCGNGTLKDIPSALPQFIRNIVLTLQLLVPIILIGLGIYDFVKAVISSDEKIMKESQNRFIKRIIASILIFMVVAIVKFVFALIPGESTLGCIPCFISDKDSCGETYECPTTEEKMCEEGEC